MNIYVYTLGCRVNQCESEALIQNFLSENWHLVKNYHDADLIIVNTCTVTSRAEQKARRMIRLFACAAPTIVTGCYTDEELRGISADVLLVPIFFKPRLLDLPRYLSGCLDGTAEGLLESVSLFVSGLARGYKGTAEVRDLDVAGDAPRSEGASTGAESHESLETREHAFAVDKICTGAKSHESLKTHDNAFAVDKPCTGAGAHERPEPHDNAFAVDKPCTGAESHESLKIRDNAFAVDKICTGAWGSVDSSAAPTSLSYPLLDHADPAALKAESDVLRPNPFAYEPADFSLHSRAYLKVQDGCDNACHYCRTRVVRGASTFLDPQEVVRRALEIEKRGYHEIVLSGINLTMYDHGGAGLGALLVRLLERLGPDMRIRLSSIEADNVDERFFSAVSDRRIQPYFHIPVQSGSDRVLKRVNRACTTAEISALVEKISRVREDPLFSCDVIAGLPSETDADFGLTVDFLQRCGFNLFHVFPFSPRRDTPLFRAPDRVPESVRDERAEILRALGAARYERYVLGWVGREVEVLLEGKGSAAKEANSFEALSGNYIRLRVENLPEGAAPGDLFRVRMTSPNVAVF